MNGDKIILPCEWNDFNYLDNGMYSYLSSTDKKYIIGEKDDKSYLINLRNKKIVQEFLTDDINKKEGSSFLYFYNKNTKKLTVYNMISNKLIELDSNKPDSIYAKFNYIMIRENKKNTYYNIKLDAIYSN